MSRNRHYCASSVIGKDVITGPDLDLLAIDGVNGIAFQEESGLWSVGG